MRFARLIAMLLGSGFALLAIALFLASLPVSARERDDVDDGLANDGYTDHLSRATATRILDLYVDREFDIPDRRYILSAVRQWNYALNGFVRFRTSLLPQDVPSSMIAEIKRTGGWIVARVDSRHPVTQTGEGRHALALTVGDRHTGFVYVISDRIGGRRLTGVVLHEFGHVLGAGHDSAGLMAPVYSAVASRCIDHDAMAMVAEVQRLPLSQLNWCVDPSGDRRLMSRR